MTIGLFSVNISYGDRSLQVESLEKARPFVAAWAALRPALSNVIDYRLTFDDGHEHVGDIDVFTDAPDIERHLRRQISAYLLPGNKQQNLMAWKECAEFSAKAAEYFRGFCERYSLESPHVASAWHRH